MSGKLELVYGAGRGAMEVPRMMLAAAGRFPPEAYSNTLITEEQRLARTAPSEGMNANLGRIPLIITEDGTAIGQTMAIYNYVAATNGFLGATPAEAAKAISFVEHTRDIKEAWAKLAPWGTAITEELLDTWYRDTPNADVDGPTKRDSAPQRAASWWMARLEHALPAQTSGPFAVGGKLSVADFALYNTFGESMKDTEPFGSKARNDALLAKHPKLKAIVENVASNPGVKQWIATRGPQQW